MKKSFLTQSMAGTFNPQKNSDLLFSDDMNAFFKNRHSSHICFVDGDEQNNDDESDKNPGSGTITLTEDQLQTLIDNSVNKALGANKKPEDEESIVDKRRREDKERDEQRKNNMQQQQLAVKGMEFDNFLTVNEKHLSGSFKEIRADVKAALGDDEDLAKSVPMMWATAAKMFFESEKNLLSLTASDQAWVKDNVLSVRYESQIDGLEAAKYLERAIETANRKADDAARRGGGGSKGNYSNHAHLAKRMDNFFPEHVADTTGL